GLKSTIEALRQTVPRVELNGAHKGRRAVALRLQQIGQERNRRWQRTADLTQPGALRVRSSQNTGVRNDRPRSLRIGMFKDNALRRQTIEVGRKRALRAQEAH